MSAFDNWLTNDWREELQLRFERWCEANDVDPEDPTAEAQFDAWWDAQEQDD